jgi:hypothetical protein
MGKSNRNLARRNMERLNELKEEIKLLERKVELLEQLAGFKKLCKEYDDLNPPYVPYVPWYPAYPTFPVTPIDRWYPPAYSPIVTYGSGTAKLFGGPYGT